MNTIYLLLGGNVGNRIENLNNALLLIRKLVGKQIKQSSIYVTAAWGNKNQPDFYNQAVCIETRLSASTLLVTLLKIEEKLGRKRDTQKWQERTIDIDILFFNDEIINEQNLKIPHPFLHDRKFVLVPLAEIAAELKHPILNKSISELLENCTDNLNVKKINPIEQNSSL